MRYLWEKSAVSRMGEALYRNRSGVFQALSMVFLYGLGNSGAAFAAAGDEIYGGNTEQFITKSVLTIKIVRFIAIFIVIAGIVWAGAEYAIKDDQRRSASILISAVVGGFAVLLAPTLINFVIGGLQISDVANIK